MRKLKRSGPGILLTLTLALAGVGAAGCERSAVEAFPVSVLVVDDQSDAVLGAHVDGAGMHGLTDSAGRFNVAVTGKAGESIAIKLTCPITHAPEPTVAPLELRALYGMEGEGAIKTIEYQAKCLRKTRSVVLAVQAHEGLPVSINGQKSGIVGASGVFYTALHVALETDFDVKLDTSQAPTLRPQNPTRVFHVTEDDVLVFAQVFQEDKPKPHLVRAHTKPARHIPQRL